MSKEKRNDNGDGTVYWDEKRRRYVIQVTDNGKRRTFDYKLAKKETKTAGKKKARALRDEIRRRQDDGIPVTSSSMKMSVLLKQWLELKKPSLRPTSYENYALMVNRYLIPRLGKIRLNKLSPERINEEWEQMRTDGLSESVIWHCHSRLATCLIYAMKRKWRIDNPLVFVPKPKLGDKTPRALSKEEMTAVLHAAKSEFDGAYHDVIHTALHTGVRRNELLALTWRDVDVYLGTINITKSISRLKGVTTVYRPKTDTGVRLVTLPPASSLLLRQVKKQQEADALFDYFVDSAGDLLLPEQEPELGTKDDRLWQYAQTFKSAINPETGKIDFDTLDKLQDKFWESMTSAHADELLRGMSVLVSLDTNVFVRGVDCSWLPGQPLLPRAVTNGFKRIAERAGYPELKYHFHESRHTHATLMLEQNVHPKVVQERLGHKDIETTLNTYSHVTHSMQREASDKFDLGIDADLARLEKENANKHPSRSR
jgi:integrase